MTKLDSVGNSGNFMRVPSFFSGLPGAFCTVMVLVHIYSKTVGCLIISMSLIFY